MNILRTRSRKYTIGSFAALATAATLVLVGCSTDSNSGSENEAGSNDQPNVQEILDRGVIKVGVCLGAPNWGFIDESGEPAGFDVDTANLLGEHLGVDVEIIETANDGRIPSIQSGAVDVISCTFTATEERKKQVDFSDAIVYTGNSVLVRSDSDISSLEDLDGVKVGVNKGGTSIAVTTANAPDAVQVPFDSFADDLTALKAGQVEAVIDTASVITQAASEDSSLKIAVDGKVGEPNYFAIGVSQDKKDVLAAVNEFVAEYHANGEGARLYEKWFWTPTYEFDGIE